MDDALLVRHFERLANLFRDWQRFIARDRTLRDSLGKRRTVDQFEHKGGPAIRLFEAVDGGNIRVIEGGEHLRFPCEAGEPIGLERKGVRQYLERDVAMESTVARAIDLTHPADAQQTSNLIHADVDTRFECHATRARLYGPQLPRRASNPR